MAYTNNWESKGVYKVFSGDVDGQQALHSIVEIEADHRFDEIRYVINDFLNVTEVSATERDIALMAAIDRAASMTNPNIRIAVVTTEERVRNLAIKYSELMRGCPYQTRLFETVDAARLWVC